MCKDVDTPIVGVTTSWTQGEPLAQSVDQRYIAAIVKAGGAPVLLPISADSGALFSAIAKLDGLVITGGNGLVNKVKEALPDDLPEEAPERTSRDLKALDSFITVERPVLGICFGMQLINIHLGGTICSDAQMEQQARPHSPKRNQGRAVEHAINVVSGSLLEEFCEDELNPTVNSFHIQAIDELGEGLRVSSCSPDGLIESIESENGNIIGVQFHPERMMGELSDNLFLDFVRRARM